LSSLVANPAVNIRSHEASMGFFKHCVCAFRVNVLHCAVGCRMTSLYTGVLYLHKRILDFV